MRDDKGRFVPGRSGNPRGRPEGSRHILSENFLKALADDFDLNGVEAIQECRVESPYQYLSVIARVIPKDIQFDHNPLEDMTQEELERQIIKFSSELGLIPGPDCKLGNCS